MIKTEFENFFNFNEHMKNEYYIKVNTNHSDWYTVYTLGKLYNLWIEDKYSDCFKTFRTLYIKVTSDFPVQIGNKFGKEIAINQPEDEIVIQCLPNSIVEIKRMMEGTVRDEYNFIFE